VSKNSNRFVLEGKFIKIAKFRDEEYEDVKDLEAIIRELKSQNLRADIFTFRQRLPHTEPNFHYYMEHESIAALPISTYKNWWEKQIDAKTRNMARKAEKKGVVIKFSEYDDEFVRGITELFNETPIRQGRPFLHYGKDFETVKKEFSENLAREDIIVAYHEGELIGFIMLADAGDYATMTQIISKIKHRDKAPNNALVAKAVEICDSRKKPHLVYAKWLDGTLGEFKRSNGFLRFDLPRYYVPLTAKGGIALKFKLHRDMQEFLPAEWRLRLKELRKRWYASKTAKEKEE
jgi:hypothetical protein